ncbi:DNA-3-methyladenine glycosylase family protein [Motiliproteus sp.]|uniref:DNA-3-methyladenine glycosylase family protein n=1 Tax=Motiliproteus sp. TaxID=1898955 RepID=UPI003BADB06B
MNENFIAEALASLSQADADVARALEQVGHPPPRIRPAGFETLLHTIVSQQISVEAARAIMGRLQTLIDPLTPQQLLRFDGESLRQAGLSARKVEYAQGLAAAICNHDLDIESLGSMDDESAIAAITQLRGFGRWSAEIYLMFSLQRADIFPADDLALRIALGRLKGFEKPTPKQCRELTSHWSPWRSAGSLLLWHYYRGAPT